MGTDELNKIVIELAQKAQEASRSIAALPTSSKNILLLDIADKLQQEKEVIFKENQKDLERGEGKGLSSAMLNRLQISEAVLADMIRGLQEIAALDDPVGEVEELRRRPSGILVGRMRVPLGVICMIYESRPNVTIDSAALCMKAGNAIILRGGSEAIHSNLVLAEVMQKVFISHGVNPDVVQVLPVTDREGVDILLQQEEYIDLVIPRGGEGLIRRVSEISRIPVLKHFKGVCHIFVDEDADIDQAVAIVINSKVQRPGVCNSLEGLLVHQDIADEFLPKMIDAFNREKVQMFGCDKTVPYDDSVTSAKDSDWGTEFLDLALVVKIVDSLDDAMEYINQYGSKHTEVILTRSYDRSQRFLREVDASAVMVNASTRFNDGGQFGLGAEIGISTTKLHAYGPMGLKELTTKKFIVFGQGEIRN